jgi:hypothetical protein
MFNDGHVVVINVKGWNVVVQISNLDDNLKQQKLTKKYTLNQYHH